jgi:autotransporter-associated beta strand protein
MFIVLGATPALASVHVWQGPASGGLWSTAANWTNGLPTSGEAGGTIVQFNGSTSTTMNMAGLTVDQIHFAGTGNSILSGGQTLGVSGSTLVTNIADDTGGNTIGTAVAISGATIFANVTTGMLTISGSISGSVGLKITGAGAGGITLTGLSDTYTGITTVAAGTLALNSNGIKTAITGSSLVVGLPGGNPATVKLQQSSEIASATNVQVANSGTFDLGSFGESIHDLTTSDGTVAIGSGSLTVGGALTMTGGAITGTGAGTLRLSADASATSSATTTATISSQVALDGDRTFTVADGPQTTDLAISNVISDGSLSSSLTKAGAGTMSITGATGNTYTGTTFVNAGTLATSHVSGVGIPAGLVIGTGAGAPASAVFRFDQSSELAPTGNVTVQQDGLFNLGTQVQTVGGLTVVGGAVSMTTGSLSVGGPVVMAGGSIDGGVNARLVLGGDVTATSSPQGSATISAHEVLTGDRTFTVSPGTAPELTISGVISEQLSSHGLTKAGGGTLLSTADNTYTGLTTVSNGSLIVRGQQPGPFSVGVNGTLAGNGAVGATSVAGSLAPEHGLRTGALSFAAGSQLVDHVTSATAALAPTVSVTGTVTIDPAAVLTATIGSIPTLPGGRVLPLIANDGSDAITGTFLSPSLKTPEGVPLVQSYTAVDGNDFALTATNVAPTAGAIRIAPNPGVAGQAFGMTVSSSDLNNDVLTTTWDFGDGTHGHGGLTAHVYTSTGVHHIVATVSDGIAHVTATASVTVTPLGTGRATAKGFGAMFTLTAPRSCVDPGTTFTAMLAIKPPKGGQIAKVTRTVFSIAGGTSKTDRSAPYRVSLTLPAATLAGALDKVSAKAYITLKNRKRTTKTLILGVRGCG